MMRLANDKPKPQPRCFVVKPGRKTVLWCLRSMPLPVSATSITYRAAIFPPLMPICPTPGMASAAFLHSTSTTHSTRGAEIGISASLSRRLTSSFTDFGMRRPMYSATRSTIVPTASRRSFGALPIFEKRSATISNRRTSASISSISSSSG